MGGLHLEKEMVCAVLKITFHVGIKCGVQVYNFMPNYVQNLMYLC